MASLYCEDAECPGMGLEIADDSQLQIALAVEATYDPSAHTFLMYDCSLNGGKGAYFVPRGGAAGGADLLYVSEFWDDSDLSQQNNLSSGTVIATSTAKVLANASSSHPLEGIGVVSSTAVFDGDSADATVKLRVQYRIDAGAWTTAYTGNPAKDPLGSITAPGYEHHCNFSFPFGALAAGVSQTWEWRLVATAISGDVDKYAARIQVAVFGVTY